MPSIVTFFDVDNTLLDNDRVVADLMRHMDRELGHERQQEYWEIFEELRHELGYADYLGALQRYREQYPRDPQVLIVSSFLVNYPFANRLFPESLDVVERAKTWGSAAILSDGDVVFQPRKIERSGLMEIVEGNILIYIHKEEALDDVERRFPAERYIVVDDKLWLLHAIKAYWGSRVTTVWPKQGHYVADARVHALPEPDVTLDRIGDMLSWRLDELLQKGRK
ncbi:MAG: haloacid dehalogenase [Acidobacteria bacterium]|nr:MAG: haloacid dehalogenase [Acidobacteriota bacterium]